MSKKFLVLSLITLFTGVANASDLSSKFEGVGVSLGVSSSHTAMGDNGTGYDIGVSYNYDINDKFFVQPSLNYITSGNAYDDKYLTGNLDLGYKFQLSNGMTLKPRVGYTYFNAMYTGGSNTGNGYNAGLELGINKNVSLDLGYKHLQGQQSGHYVDLTSLAIKYTF